MNDWMLKIQQMISDQVSTTKNKCDHKNINFRIFAVRDIFIPKINKTDKQYIDFYCLQPPASMIWNIMNNENPIDTYKDWVENSGIFSGGVVENELLELNVWIESAKNEGFDIRWEIRQNE